MRWWQRLDDQGRRHASWIVLCGVVYIIHYLVYCLPQPFFIEDAAITFTYSEHLIRGEGLVTYPGGERVEGYSNALWMFILAGLYGLGLPTWTSAKILGAILGVATLPLVFDLTRRMKPEGRQDAAWLAPLALALTPPFVVWNASGLENSLFAFLLAAGTWRLLREDEDSSLRPLSALLFVLLTMTRPEGMMYAAIALLARVMFAIAGRKPLSVLSWLAVFAVPWVVYNGWRYWYFAWEFPNTYYAKLGAGKSFKPFGWTIKGWKYIKNYLSIHGIVYALPMLFFALGGLAGNRRRRLSVALIALLTFMVFYDGKFIGQPDWLPESINWPNKPSWWRSLSSHWVEARVWMILGAAGLMGVVTLSRPGWRARGTMWAYCASGVFFALYAGGDWMDEWRWFNIVSVSLFPLLTVGLGELLDYVIPSDIKRRIIPTPLSRWGQEVSLRVIVMAAVMIPFTINEINRATRFSINPETSVRDIHRRVRYMTWVQNRLDVDDIVLLDVDMGAHMYYSGWDIVDIAGLVDIPMARHSDFNKKFIAEYLFEERLPDFAHVHAGWARSSKIPRQMSWKKDYIEIPGYPIGGRKLHVGNHIRKDLFIERHTGEEPAHRFEGGIELLSYRLPSPEVAPGGQVHLRTWWRAVSREENFSTLVWLDDGAGNRAVTALEPGYGWYEPEEWHGREKVAGRFWIQVPGELPPGTYKVGIVLLDATTGEVLPLITGEPDEPVFLAGEVVLSQTVEVVSQEIARQHAEDDRAEAGVLATSGDCEAVWPKWKDATRHLSRNTTWREKHEDTIRTALAGCWLTRAQTAEDRPARIAYLKEARGWDHRLDGLGDAVKPLAAELDAEGDVLFAEEDWKGAYRVWSDALALNPSLSWTRRKAEEARDKRLVISRPGELLPAEGAEFTPLPPGADRKREMRPRNIKEDAPDIGEPGEEPVEEVSVEDVPVLGKPATPDQGDGI